MTRYWPRILLALFCYLLTVATSASAECAWVLWFQLGRGAYGAYPSKAFESKAACDQALTVQGRWQEDTIPKASERAVYVCLPDTVDPSGPKGK